MKISQKLKEKLNNIAFLHKSWVHMQQLCMAAAPIENVLGRDPGTQDGCKICNTNLPPLGSPKYPFVNQPEREDVWLGGLHGDCLSQDSNPGLRINS